MVDLLDQARGDVVAASGRVWPNHQLRAKPAAVYKLTEAEAKTLGKKSMHKLILILLTAAAFGAAFGAGPARAQSRGTYEVAGVEAEDMLKMRAGPGINYRIVAGLPNGTALWVQSCERSGSTSWCKVSLKQARGLKGYVSSAYLRKVGR